MIQTFRSSSQYWSLQHLRPEKGFQAWPESATKHTKILYQNKENIYTRLCSHINILDSTDIFRSSCNQQRTYRDQLVQTFRTTSNGEFVIEPNDDKKVTPQSNLWAKWDAFYRFCQLYTATGVVIAVVSVALLPMNSVGEFSPAFFVGLLQALISFTFANTYINGINQLADVEIDKINKPYFPLASGELSMRQGKAITSAFGLMCLAMGIMCKSPPLFIGILVLFLLGTAYSVELPYLRWKTNPYLAAICIVSAQGFTTPPTVFCHIQHVLGKPVAFTKSFRFATIFFSLFALVLALFKDIPDVEGDRAFGNQTFSVRHGKKKVFSLCVSILVIAYGYALVIGASSSVLICKIVSVIGHLTLAALLLFRAKSVNLDDNESTQSFYKLLWKMLCAEYILIHLIR
ncbi:umbelliferone 6-dimethylallyltransferase, chloroplastic-like isoform X1 [Daucus carota subsp. sativus]|uniref:umbelliferone 6-dimethylallyltransferase, chloroplastic-like isoform X1 n=1 Tax=Daucus carota subsp. sativus TaxID=79200 RepID=UPI0007EF83A7|nr:PREDICTED: homogentisate phytyltransferase 1, chloroplastic-like isoform X1 [Daucus carota subsp. sativus]